MGGKGKKGYKRAYLRGNQRGKKGMSKVFRQGTLKKNGGRKGGAIHALMVKGRISMANWNIWGGKCNWGGGGPQLYIRKKDGNGHIIVKCRGPH